MNRSKAAIAMNQIVVYIEAMISLVLVLFGFIGFCVNAGDPEGWLSLLLIVLGIVIYVFAFKLSRLIKHFKEYVAILPNVPNGYIPDIAATVGSSADKVRKNLVQMIKKNFFVNASIDAKTDCLILPNRRNVAPMDATVQPGAYAAPAQEAAMVTVKCKSCGGINVVQRGKVGVCDYCGSSFTAE